MKWFSPSRQIPEQPEPSRDDLPAWVDWQCRFGGLSGVARALRALSYRIAALEQKR